MAGDQGLYKWLREGYEKGYCSDLYCENHDGVHRDDMETYEKLLEEYEGNDSAGPLLSYTPAGMRVRPTRKG